MEKIDFVTKREIIELFVNRAIFEIQNTREIPKINFIFDKQGLLLIESVKKKPFKKEGYYIPDISNEDYELLLSQNKIEDDAYNIVVHDANKFFTLLTEIINEQVKLEYRYYKFNNARFKALLLLRRIWLRMSNADFYNIESFLELQRDFIKNREFDTYEHDKKLINFLGNDIYYSISPQETYYETSRVARFYVYDSKERHDLANILFDIREENGEKVCYIYAIQKPKMSKRSKRLERNLYKINSLCPNGISNVHPNFSVSLLLFVNLLKSHEINHIKVPMYQSMSYDYHILLSKNTKESFDKKWSKEKLDEMSRMRDSDYRFERLEFKDLTGELEQDKEWYNRVVDKEDFISKAKTEGLLNTFLFLESINEITINDLPLNDMTYLDVNLDNERALKL